MRRYARRGDAQRRLQVLAHRGAGAETGLMGDPVDAQVGGLQQLPGEFDTLLGQPLAGAHPHLLAETPGEGAHAHRLPSGELRQGERLAEPAEGPGAGPLGAGELRVGQRTPDVLRLAALALRWHDGAARDRVGHRRTEVAADDVQAQVDARGDPAEVSTSPSSTYSTSGSTLTCGKSRWKWSALLQWVVRGGRRAARRPPAGTSRCRSTPSARPAGSRRTALVSGVVSLPSV